MGGGGGGGGGVFKLKKTFRGRGMDIFWNNTFSDQLVLANSKMIHQVLPILSTETELTLAYTVVVLGP